MIPTFRPWTHTSDDSYIYQLSLVVATATVSSLFFICAAIKKLLAWRFRPGTKHDTSTGTLYYCPWYIYIDIDI